MVDVSQGSSFGVALDRAVDAVERLGPAAAAVIRSVRDPAAAATPLWSVGDVAAHLSHVCAIELLAARRVPAEQIPDTVRQSFGWQDGGEPMPDVSSIEDVARMNDFGLRQDPVRDPSALAARIESSVGDFVAFCRSSARDEVVTWLLDAKLPLSALAGHLLFELSLHGFDVARGSGGAWRIEPEVASMAIEGFLLPLIAQGAFGAVEGPDATCEMRIRGGPRFEFVQEGRGVTVRRPGRRRADLTIRTDPVTALLVMSGRRGRVSAALSGRMLAFGRRPMRAMRMLSSLKTP